MVHIEDERDIETLRQVARLLDRENERLHVRIEKLIQENAALKGGNAEEAQREIEGLRELLAQRERALFGDSSEKRDRTAAGDGPRKAQKGHGPTEQPKLPVVDVVHPLPGADRACASCGKPLEEMAGQYEDSEEITVVERRFVVTRHRRQKYRCRCNARVATAAGPTKLQEGGRYSVDFAIEVAASKYLDHLPLARQERIMRREGLYVTSQTLWDQIELLARVVMPAYRDIRRDVIASSVIGADETHWRVMGQPEEKKRWWAWCASSPRAVYYEIHDSRSQDAASKVLAGYEGIVVADGYGAYSALARASPGFTLVNCWAHVRRKFIDIEENFPEPCRQILDLIGELYAVERSVIGDNDDERSRHRAELRRTRSKEILDRMQRWVAEQRALPQSGLGKAIAYMTGLWPGLVRFVENPYIPLDNNATERALRGPVVGRKNFYGARSRRGTEVAALFYSIFETAKLRADDPKEYLKGLVLRYLADPQPAAA